MQLSKTTVLESNLRYASGLMRALLGAMIFALPLTMTMEMWDLGVTIDPFRLTALLTLTFPMLVALSFYAGFEATFSLLDNILDAFAAMAVSAVVCLVVLFLFGAISPDMPLQEIAGKLMVLSFGASIGALLADKQFNDKRSEVDSGELGRGFASRLFVMAVGAIFLSLNVAPTEEVAIIAANISPALAVALASVSLLALGVVLAVVDPDADHETWLCRARRAFAGYGMCLLLAGFVLWCFGRLDGLAFAEAVESIIVLGFPAALGAGAARLILGGKEEQDG
jgi:putative integral membrane protein (TIGR02587 family)